MHISCCPGIALPLILLVLALSQAFPALPEPQASHSPELAPGIPEDRKATGIIPTAFNVPRPPLQAAPNLTAPNLAATNFEEIVSSGIDLFSSQARSLAVWRVMAVPFSAMEGSQAADFTRVRLECQITLPFSGERKLIRATNKRERPLEWSAPHVTADLTSQTPWKPYDWTAQQTSNSLKAAFELLAEHGPAGVVWSKIVQVTYNEDDLEPETKTPSGQNQVYFAFARVSQEPPFGYRWTFVGTTSGRIHRDIFFDDPQRAPDAEYGEMDESASNGTRIVA